MRPKCSHSQATLNRSLGRKKATAVSSRRMASIDNMRKLGWITAEFARSLGDRAALNSAKGQSDDTDTYNVNRVWNGQDPKFDPKDPKAGKSVDTFKTVTAANGFARCRRYDALAVSTMQHTKAADDPQRDYRDHPGNPDQARRHACKSGCILPTRTQISTKTTRNPPRSLTRFNVIWTPACLLRQRTAARPD